MASPIPPQSASRTSTGALSQQPTLVGGNSPPPRATGIALTRAITQFRNKLTGTELAGFTTTTYDQLCQAVLQVQHEQEQRMEARNLARIKSCLEAMHQFGQVIEIFLNVSDAVAFVWGPMKFILLVSTLSAQNETSVNRLHRQLARLQTHSTNFWTRMRGSANNCRCWKNTNHCFINHLT